MSAINLREIYAQPGEYSVKMIIDPRESQEIESLTVSVRNSDGRAMEHTHRRWGTKLTVQFSIDETTPDGVSVIDVSLSGRAGRQDLERFSFWVVK